MIRVLVVDDSAVIRRYLTEELNKQPDIEVIAVARDPYEARERIIELRPDVLTLDIEMPRMDGLSFLSKLMASYPLPVVIVSSLTPKHSPMALKALAMGAIEVIAKPGSSSSVLTESQFLVKAVRGAAQSKVHRRTESAERARPALKPVLTYPSSKGMVVIGASTGGTVALTQLIQDLPSEMPPILIVQHMREYFTKTFAERLNQLTDLTVREAADGDPVKPCEVLLAPGNYHMALQAKGFGYVVAVKSGPPVHFQRPAVDVLFQSVARTAKCKVVGVLLTGMGQDGAKGMLALKEHHAWTLVQDEESCTVFGMPKEAIKLGAYDRILPLKDMGQGIVHALNAERKPLRQWTAQEAR